MFLLDERIFRCIGKMPILSRLVPHVIIPIHPLSPFPNAATELYSIMSQASGNARSIRNSSADVPLVQHMATIRPLKTIIVPGYGGAGT
jgi:hypothetical protein